MANWWDQYPVDGQPAQPKPQTAPVAPVGGKWWEQHPVAPAATQDDGTTYVGQAIGGLGQGLLDAGKLVRGIFMPGPGMDMVNDLAQKDLGQFLEKKSTDPGKAFTYSAGQGIGAAVPTAGMGGGVATNLALGAMSGLGAETGRQVAPGNPYAEVAGALVAPVATSALLSAPKALLQGGAQKQIAQNVDDFARAGTTPTAGQAVSNIVAQGGESILAKVPGSAGRLARVYDRQQAQIGQRLTQIADNLAPGANPESAGRAVQGGINQFVAGSKQKAEQLFNEVDRFVPGQSAVPVQNALQTAKQLSTPVAGAPTVGASLVNKKIASIAQALEADAGQTGALPYQALKELRSAVGREAFSTDMLIDAAPRAQMKQLYGALTEDMKQAAIAAGPQAERAFNRANGFYSALNQRVDDFLNGLSNKVEPAKVFAALQSNSREGGQMVNAVMRSLNPQERKVVVSAVLQKMGKALSGKQDDLGEVFSTETFLTNWDKLTPRAKQALFQGQAGLSDDLNAIAAASSRIRDARQILANPSGTAQASLRSGAVVASATGAVTGQWWIPLTIGATAASANGGARLMSSPAFVRWLAAATRSNKADALNAIARLPVVVKEDPSLKEDIAAYAKTLRDAIARNNQPPTSPQTPQ